MSEAAAVLTAQRPDVFRELSGKYGIDMAAFYNVVVKQLFPPTQKYPNPPTREEVIMFLTVCREYNLNPFIGEIFPIRTQGGSIKAYIPIDGWITMVSRQPQYAGNEFEVHMDADKRVIAVTCRIYRNDRPRHVEMTEYMSECNRDTDPWKKWPIRMLHHKAFIQTARYAFGFSGIVDEDEAGRLEDAITIGPSLAQPRRLPEKAESVAGSEMPQQTPQQETRQPEPVAARPAARPAPQQAQQAPAPEPKEGLFGEEDQIVGPDEIKKLWDVAYEVGWKKTEIESLLTKKYGVTHFKALKKGAVAECLADLKAGFSA